MDVIHGVIGQSQLSGSFSHGGIYLEEFDGHEELAEGDSHALEDAVPAHSPFAITGVALVFGSSHPVYPRPLTVGAFAEALEYSLFP